MDNKAAVRAILEDAASDPMDDWRHTRGILKTTVRLDIPLRDPQETLHLLRYMAEELPRICLRIEVETSPLERQIMAQQQLEWLRARVKRNSGKR